MFYETSAKQGVNVTKAFVDLSKCLIEKKVKEEDNLNFTGLNNNKPG